MLDAYIIEQLRRREEERRHQERPRLELPLYPEPPDEDVEDQPEPARVIVIDL